MFYSIIIPVYNRPDELEELLATLVHQRYKDFEVVVVEDGSTEDSGSVIDKFKSELDIVYHVQENTGQGFARNAGFEIAKGDYFIIFDSDCLIPAHYLELLDQTLEKRKLDAFGGPDAAHSSFTTIQKAISYAMTSFFTTGGIRGKKQHLGPYHPRSFNMGIRRKVFEDIGGFRITRLGEDIDFSIRIIDAGYKTGLIEGAYVYHKRRTDFGRFFNQLYFFGQARINIYKMHPSELKLVHFFPAIFALGFFGALLMSFLGLFIGHPIMVLPLFLFNIYGILVFFDATAKNRSFLVGLYSVPAAFIQLCAYGMGFINDFWSRVIRGKESGVEEYPQ